jgi:hypothetical protein
MVDAYQQALLSTLVYDLTGASPQPHETSLDVKVGIIMKATGERVPTPGSSAVFPATD